MVPYIFLKSLDSKLRKQSAVSCRQNKYSNVPKVKSDGKEEAPIIRLIETSVYIINPEGKRDDYTANGNAVEYGDIQQNKAQDIKLNCGGQAVIQIQGSSCSNIRYILIIRGYYSPDNNCSVKFSILYVNIV